MAVAVYMFESKARGTSKRRGKNTDFGCMCVGIRRKYRRGSENTEIYLGTQLENCRYTHTHTHTHTHSRARSRTHTFYHSWQILGTAHQKGAIKVWDVASLRNVCDPLISWLPHTVRVSSAGHTVRAEPRAACTVVQLARSSKKLGHHFSIQSDRRAVEVCCVQCSIFVQVCPSHQLGD